MSSFVAKRSNIYATSLWSTLGLSLVHRARASRPTASTKSSRRS